MSTPTVFLSTATGDLKDWRDILHKAFERAGCKVFTQGHSLGAFTADVPQLLLHHLDKSDFVIHLAGLAYGTEPERPPFDDCPDFHCSYTQFEYYYAHRQGKQVIAFVCAENFPYRQFTEEATGAADLKRRQGLQAAHRTALANGRFDGTPLAGHPTRPLSERVGDVNALLQAVAAAVGTIRELSPTCMSSAQAELQELAKKRHDELMAYIADLPTRVADELERRRLIRPAVEFRADISRISKYAPAELIGRAAETQLLTGAWDKVVREEKGRPRVLTFVALGGEGKTSLVAKWAADLAGQGWPGCDAAFAWSFYSQGTREQLAASSDLFLKEALTFFGDDDDRAFAASPAGAFDKGQRLARVVGRRCALLILDGLEPLQYAPTAPTPGELKDQGIAALLRGLAASSHGLCVVTTRYSVPDLRAFWQTTAPEEKLLRLSRDAGVHLLRSLGVKGSAAEFEALVEDVKGHALTLTLLGGFLKRAFRGDIRQRDRVTFEKADEKMDGGHAFRTMAAYEEWLLRDGGAEGRREVAVLRLMGLFDRPADAGCLAALWGEPVPGLTDPLAGLADDDWEFCLSGLEAAKLLTVNRDPSGALTSLDAHPHLRAYFAKQLSEKKPEAWRAGHKRIYDHLCATTKEGDQPTLEDLQPLYQAVAHGCLAGLQLETWEMVWLARIRRMNERYSTRNLGAYGSNLGALICFFDIPWCDVSQSITKYHKALLLDETGYALKALGRLTDALEPFRSALALCIKQEHWVRAANSANNLSELELSRGKVAGAVEYAAQSVTYADSSGDAFQRLARRATHAYALHQAGRHAEAEARFREAEQMQGESEPDFPLLYSLRGFQYCDLLLAGPEYPVWGQEKGGSRKDELLAVCRAVSRRAAQTLKWVTDARLGLLTIALNHLTLGRAALFEAILAHSDLRVASSELDAAVSGLRRAATQDHIPAGLLTRAWLRAITGIPTGHDSAQADLDEAWEIAERGPMPLFLADIHLYRARLFYREAAYPWESPATDLAAAEALIKKCGYHRRDEELADAKAAILGTK